MESMSNFLKKFNSTHNIRLFKNKVKVRIIQKFADKTALVEVLEDAEEFKKGAQFKASVRNLNYVVGDENVCRASQ